MSVSSEVRGLWDKDQLTFRDLSSSLSNNCVSHISNRGANLEVAPEDLHGAVRDERGRVGIPMAVQEASQES